MFNGWRTPSSFSGLHNCICTKYGPDPSNALDACSEHTYDTFLNILTLACTNYEAANAALSFWD